ncbi:SAM-dependent methyltransferase [Streptomyces sp. SM12]|uniref:SAM-dependent methyltransferase n=1 Tax=Streptomyces sp. SM12 TaxID=1071602 RepID=UPI000CD59664|nr:SAM-dependent methyltransferase [Streptomyces sp. SM12]
MSEATSAGAYDWFLSGKDASEADIAMGEWVEANWPGIRTAAQANRAFVLRSTRWLVETGVEQLLDLGAGIPTSPAIHEVAHDINPDVGVVYVEMDRRVALRVAADLTAERVSYVEGNAIEVAAVLSHPDLLAVLDLDRPVAVLMNALLHYVPDEMGPLEAVRAYMDAVPSGSYLVISHVTPDFAPHQVVSTDGSGEGEEDLPKLPPGQPRSSEELLPFLTGLEIVEPGIVTPPRWRPGPEGIPAAHDDATVSQWAVVARKP